MSLDPRQNPVAIVTALATLLGLGLAVRMGQAAANNNYTFIAMVLCAGVGLLLVFAFREFAWLLIPLGWALAGRLGFLPIPFSVKELCVLGAFGVFVSQIAMKQWKGASPRTNILDTLFWINVAIIAIMWLRKPVGLAFLGTETVGGRPYFGVILGILAMIVVAHCVMKPKLGFYFPLFLSLPSFLVGFLGVLTYVFPALTPIIHPIYSGIDVSSYVTEEMMGQQATPATLQEGRFSTLSSVGIPLLLLLVCYHSPLKAMNPMRPKLFLLFFLALFAVGMAGFRNVMFQAMLIIMIGAYIWNRAEGVFKVITLGATAIIFLIATQGVFELPRSIQRSLVFLPGPWNEQVRQGAKNSTDWRVDMWIIALTTDRYIKDKIFGDGFGFTRKELELMLSGSTGGVGFLDGDATKESFMIQGSFHSGPVSSIRFAGVVGLLALVALQVAIAIETLKLLKRAKKTPFQPIAIYLAVSSVMRPIFFVFVFGEYRTEVPDVFFTVGLCKLLDNSLRMHAAQQNPTAHATPRPVPTRPGRLAPA